MGAGESCVHFEHTKAVFRLGRSSKSKRFVQQGKDAVKKHAEQFPYHSTFAEAEADSRGHGFTNETVLGGTE